MNDYDMLITAIINNPDDDVLRLAFADLLQEQGQEERAELVRLQCELDKTPCRGFMYSCQEMGRSRCECSINERVVYLLGREVELTDKHAEWLPECPTCHGDGYESVDYESDSIQCDTCSKTGRIGTFHKGLLTVRVPTLETVLERVCSRCSGIRFYADLYCDRCGGVGKSGRADDNWQLTEWAKRLKQWPVERVEVDYYEPHRFGDGRYVWYKQQYVPMVSIRHCLPETIARYLKGWRVSNNHTGAEYATEEAANDALTRAVALLVREG